MLVRADFFYWIAEAGPRIIAIMVLSGKLKGQLHHMPNSTAML